MSESNENQSGCGCIFSIIALIAGLAKIVISFSKLGGGSGAIIGIVVAIAIAIIFFAIEASKEKTNLDDDPTGYAAREKREKAKRKMQEIQNSFEESNTKQEGSTTTYGLNEVVNNETPTSSTEDKEEYDYPQFALPLYNLCSNVGLYETAAITNRSNILSPKYLRLNL